MGLYCAFANHPDSDENIQGIVDEYLDRHIFDTLHKPNTDRNIRLFNQLCIITIRSNTSYTKYDIRKIIIKECMYCGEMSGWTYGTCEQCGSDDIKFYRALRSTIRKI